MDEQKNNNDINLLAKEYADQAVREARKSRGENGRNALTKLMILFSLAVLAFAVFIFATIAWFTMNREVGTSGMGVQVAGTPFELAVSGTNVGALSYEQSGTAESPTYTPSEIYGKAGSDTTAKELTDGSLQNGTYYTDGSNPKIKWRLTDEYNDKGLGPNSQGALTFYVIPKSSGTFDVNFSISLEGYTATQSKNRNGSYDVESISVIGENGTTDEKAALNYLNGHILFFSGRRNTGTEEKPVYEYTGFLDVNDFSLSEVNGGAVSATADTPIPVTIYWVWANTFGQMVFSAEDNGNKVPVGYDSGTRANIREFIVDNPTWIFDDMTEASVLSKLAVRNDDVYTFDETTVGSGTNYADLTLGYNKADQKIGTSIRYMLLILEAH